MNSKKLTTSIIFISILLITLLPLGKVQLFAEAAVDNNKSGAFQILADEDVIVNKYIVDEKNKTYIDGSISVIIEITNTLAEDIYNVSLYSPETNITYLNELTGQNIDEDEEDSYTLDGEPNKEWSSILSGQSVSTSYQIIPHVTGIFTFAASNITFAYADTSLGYSESDEIKFLVYPVPPSIIIEKTIYFDGDYTNDSRVRIGEQFGVNISITNYFYYNNPIDIAITDPGLPTGFEYDDTKLTDDYTDLGINETIVFSYDVETNSTQTELLGKYVLDGCQLDYTFENLTSFQIVSNEVLLEVYKPIYTGNDIEKKVPLLSIQKFFVVYNEELEITQYLTQLEVFNTTTKPIEIFINVTNLGIVNAFDIIIQEPRYRSFVFETVGLQEWRIANLTQYETYNFSYTISPVILGTFNIEATNITYSYVNQKTLLNVTGMLLYSNILELVVTYEEDEPSFTQQWLIISGISVGIILLGVAPVILSFISYRKRRKTQKGI